MYWAITIMRLRAVVKIIYHPLITNKYEEKLVIFQSIESCVVTKSKETSLITYAPADILVGN